MTAYSHAEPSLPPGEIKTLTMIVDKSIISRQGGQFARAILSAFGDNAIRCTKTHAKFALLSNDDWSVTIQSSMNLNKNPRFEQYDIDDNPAIFALFLGHVKEMIELGAPGCPWDYDGIDATLLDAMGGGLADYDEGGLPDFRELSRV